MTADWRAFPCKPWEKALNSKGYGKRKFRGKTVGAHRAAWIEEHGDVPDGLFVLHRCDNRPCTEPRHLFLGTQQDNLDDMAAKGRGTQGGRNNTTKLTEADVLAIRASGLGSHALALQYGVRRYTIQCILAGKTWKHLLPERQVLE